VRGEDEGEANVGAGDVGAVEIGVDGGGVLSAESLAEDPEVMDSGTESMVGVRRCTWKMEGWIEVMEYVRSVLRNAGWRLRGGGTSDGDGENERLDGL
jgi:hypothetical protein